MKLLGISAFYHDSAAALVIDGEIVAAAQEERFTRKKHDHEFPLHAARYCLRAAGLQPNELDGVVFYDRPLTKFDRLLETYFGTAPFGIRSFLKAMPLWLRQKLWVPDIVAKKLEYKGKVYFTDHHESHAASAYYPSPFDEAAVLTIDGVGEWSTNTLWHGQGTDLTLLSEIRFPHSLGLLYSAFTYFTGFKVNSGEYKVMGLAPYGQPKYVQTIYDNILDLKPDGSYKLDQRYFDYCAGLTMTNGRFAELFGGPARAPESQLTQREMDLAASIQVVTEEVMLRQARHARAVTGAKNLCLAGGVALNCVGNGKILREAIFENLWIQPAAGDAGGALGAALAVWYRLHGGARTPLVGRDRQKASLLGPAFGDDEIEAFLREVKAPFRKLPREELLRETVALLADDRVVGWLQGRMEFGPRALGGRSILGDPRSRSMQSKMNLKIKFRESFRPFAPSAQLDHCQEFFDLPVESPYMLLVAPVQEDIRIPMTEEQQSLFGIEKLHIPRSSIPAVTHVDYSARVQTVKREDNPLYYDLIDAFRQKTGCALVVNTSFNVRGEPIVCTPRDAYTCFMRTEMDNLVLGSYLLEKSEQPPWAEQGDWRETYGLD
jgi:carbamoyltransferase